MKKRMKRLVAVGLVTAMTGTMLLGCGGGSGSDSESDTTSDGKVKIRFASWETGDTLDSQQECVDQFNESQDKIEVVLEGWGSDFDTKMTASMGAGDAPDVMYMWDYPTYSESLEPLDEYIEAEGEDYKNNFFEALWPYNSMNDQIYGVSVSVVTSCLYYNKDLFDQAGVEYPTDDWTWEDVAEASKQIQSKIDDVNAFTLPIGTLPYTLEMYLWSNGTAFVDENGKLDGNINSDKSIEVFQTFQDMEKDGVLYASEESGQTEMPGGKTAMYVDGTWPIKQFDEEGLNYGIAQIPKFEGTEHSISVINTSGIAISKDSKHKEEAWEFLKFWTGEEMNKYRINTELPALKSVVDSEGLREDEKYAPFYTALDNCAGYVPASFITEGWTEIDADVQLAFESIINPSSLADVKDTLNEVVEAHE